MTKSIFGKFRKLENKKKLQLVIAVSLSVVLLVALPVYAWFTHKRSIALTTKINAPTQFISPQETKNLWQILKWQI
ncbi:hypothetical protein [Ruminococcus bicirculans (ex Wegman et al. 2014)]|uniref:hypothetical protein n=1 Tax=Ruminococcus bicirculans (ex Wegman et al. 2014) TaxID=1160721 RepID=UPI00242DD8E6|nr:hypothetical protein [Ruminococcus bicirculans (ex Wegman et al. 2014)]MBS6632693.1 hypothetical protein [Ruminococcus bicirculans (ex Wegman et al. 2014)]